MIIGADNKYPTQLAHSKILKIILMVCDILHLSFSVNLVI